MSGERMGKMLELLKQHKTDEDLIGMIAELRESFLNCDKVSERNGYDILGEVASCPSHVLYYVAEYIAMLEQSK